MKQRLFTLLAVMMTILLAVGVSASAGMYVYDSDNGDYRTPENTTLDVSAVALWLEDGIAAGYNDPNYTDEPGAAYLSKLESGWYEIVLCGLGTNADDFPEEVNGKIAFCIRGDSTFTIKTKNAMNAGAVACLIGNNCRAAEQINENGIVTSGTYENIAMNLDYYTIPAASLSSDITVRLVAAAADVTIAEAVNKVTEVFNGATEFALNQKQTARVFLGTEKEYWDSFGLEENTWHTYRNLRWYFDETTSTLTIAGEGAIPDLSSSQYPWYTYLSKIRTVIIEEGITELSKKAMSSFGSFYVTKICLPATLTAMDAYEFSFFNKLANITVSEANERYYVEDGILYESANNEIHLLVYPRRKEDCALYTIPEGVTHIGKQAFYENAALTKLILPKSLENIAEDSFYLPELVEFTIDPENAEYTVENGILYTKDMTALIAYPAMHPNTTYTFPDSVTTISTSMFFKTAALETLIIPATVTEILSTYALAFDNIQLKEIIVDEENPNYCSSNGILYSKDMTTLIFYPPCKNDTEYRMPNTVTFIRNHAFARLVYMEKLYFSPNLKDWHLMSSIFSTTPSLTSIYFYNEYDPRMSAPFLSMYMSGQIFKVTLYYIEGMNNWTSPTLSFGFATAKTATFDPEEGILDIPGDITGDGKADREDLRDLANYFAGHTNTAFDIVLGDEKLSEKVSGFDDNPEDFSRYDAMYIARALAGWEGYELP